MAAWVVVAARALLTALLTAGSTRFSMSEGRRVMSAEGRVKVLLLFLQFEGFWPQMKVVSELSFVHAVRGMLVLRETDGCRC
jgi:hypothetical protein